MTKKQDQKTCSDQWDEVGIIILRIFFVDSWSRTKHMFLSDICFVFKRWILFWTMDHRLTMLSPNLYKQLNEYLPCVLHVGRQFLFPHYQNLHDWLTLQITNFHWLRSLERPFDMCRLEPDIANLHNKLSQSSAINPLVSKNAFLGIQLYNQYIHMIIKCCNILLSVSIVHRWNII